jgi:hypothetical protein
MPLKQQLREKRSKFDSHVIINPHQINLMKTLLFVLFALTSVTAAIAQGCTGYYFLLDNAAIEMTITDGKGLPVGKNLYRITAVNNDGSERVSDFVSTFQDMNGKVLTKSQGKFKCSGDKVAIDMKMSMPNMPQTKDIKMEAKSSEAFLTYPAKIMVTDTLPDGHYEMESNNNGISMNMVLDITNRKVIASEGITTTAGSWNCFVITSNVDMKMQVMGVGVPISIRTKEWFAPGFGPVKSESYDQNGQLMGGTMITMYKH